jgi:hypothetical protein
MREVERTFSTHKEIGEAGFDLLTALDLVAIWTLCTPDLPKFKLPVGLLQWMLMT